MLKKERIFDISMMAITFILIITTAIIFKQSFLRILPLFISLFVMLLQSKVNTVGYLIGGLNSVLYAAVFTHYGIYASAAQALLFSFPLQIITFFRWKKRAYGSSTVLRKLSIKQRIIGVIGFAILWAAVSIVLNTVGGSYEMLDSGVALLGIISTVFSMLAFCEYTYLKVISNFISVVLYFSMLKETPEQATYFVYSLYAVVCCVREFVNAHKLYKKQRREEI